MTPRILVTGGLGFLGSHLVEELLEREPEAEVHVVDDQSSSAVSVAPSGATLHRQTLREFLLWNDLAFSQIYHLASVVGPAGILPHAGRIVGSVVQDTYALADAALRWDARMLDVSTSEIYGGGQGGLCGETMPRVIQAQTTVRLEYAVAKLAAETALINLPNLDCVIVRPFNIAGPRQSSRGGFVLPRFIESALAGSPLTVFGSGEQVRAFTHVRDTAHGLRLAMHKGRPGQAYNLGAAQNRTTILGLAERVLSATGSASPIHHVDPRTIYGPLYAEAADKWPDPLKSEAELGFKPRWDLDDIIRDTLRSLKAAA